MCDLGGDGPPLLLAHATGFHGHVWLPVVAHLRSRFRCLAFDERGHGESRTPPGETFDWHHFADDVLAVVDGFGLEQAIGVGHSCGAAALLMAEQDRPGTFRSLWCYEPVVVPVDPPPAPSHENPLTIGARRRREVFPSREDALANFASKPPFDALHPDALAAYVDHGFDDLPDGTVRLKCRRDDEAEIYAHGFAHGAFGRFGEIACPVHLACGERTDAITPGLIAAQAAALKSATTEVMPGLGHFGPLQDPPAIAASILSLPSLNL
jgi:pimeloyl-ACP methyl ester carboxylesterase